VWSETKLKRAPLSFDFTTDTKLAAKIARGGVKFAKKNGFTLRHSIERTVPKLLAAQRGRRHKNGAHTLDPPLKQVERIAKYRPKIAIADRGYSAKSMYSERDVVTAKLPKKDATNYGKRRARQRFR
jgi:hypothetical protein